MSGGLATRRRLARPASCRGPRHQRGIVAIEAALILPVLILMIFMAVEVYSYFRAATVLSRTASTLAETVARTPNWRDQGNCTQAQDVCTLPALALDVAAPIPFASGGRWQLAVVAADGGPEDDPLPVGDPSTWLAAPAWSRNWTGSEPPPAPANSQATWPPAEVGDTLIVVEASYRYNPVLLTPALWAGIVGNPNLNRRALALAPGSVRVLDD